MPTTFAQMFNSCKSTFLEESAFIGFSTETSLLQDRTEQVFKQLMIWRTGSKEYREQPVYDIKVYPQSYFSAFDPNTTFKKWAAVKQLTEPSEEDPKLFTLIEGTYLCFASDTRVSAQFFQELYTSWLPRSQYELDARPHFDKIWPNPEQRGAILREEIYIPVK